MRTEKAMLAQIGDETKIAEMVKSERWHFERKYDGERGLLSCNRDGLVELFNRNGKDTLMHYPELKAIGDNLPLDTVLDGEIYVGANADMKDKPTTSGRAVLNSRDTAMLSKVKPATYMCFDVLRLGGEDLEGCEYELRKEALARIETSMRVAKLEERFYGIFPEENPMEAWEAILRSGDEGMVAKRVGSRYQHCRSPDWVKLKTWVESDFKVIGITTEKREISALILEGGLKVNCALAAESYVKLTEQLVRSGKAIKCVDGTLGFGIDNHYTAKVKYLNKSETGLRFPILRELVE